MGDCYCCYCHLGVTHAVFRLHHLLVASYRCCYPGNYLHLNQMIDCFHCYLHDMKTLHCGLRAVGSLLKKQILFNLTVLFISKEYKYNNLKLWLIKIILHKQHYEALYYKLIFMNTWLAVNRWRRAECDRVSLMNEMSKARGLEVRRCHSCWRQQVVPGWGGGMWRRSCYVVRREHVMTWRGCHRTTGQTALQCLRISH